MGVVTRLPAGRAYLYSLNRRSYLVSKVLLPAFQHEAGWLEELGHAVYRLGPKSIDAVLLYGSWARGRAGRKSDVDLLVVGHLQNQPFDLSGDHRGAFFARRIARIRVPRDGEIGCGAPVEGSPIHDAVVPVPVSGSSARDKPPRVKPVE